MLEVEQKRRILPVTIGTAGHVDHGKTALVKSLTGRDTDTLPEEKRRQLTIDLGYAPIELSDGLAGLIDVPGHEDFIRNMVAGAASINIVILTVAADDGIMPQTIEHAQIIRLLAVPRMVVAITKIDLVDNARVNAVQGEVARLLARVGYPDAPLVRVSNRTAQGVATLRDTLVRMAATVALREPSTRRFRMNVGRVFGVKGQGTVITGVPSSGRVCLGDPLELLPGGMLTRVRRIESYRTDAKSVDAHVCGALLLKDLPIEAFHRGMTIADPGVFRAVTSALINLRNVSSVNLKRDVSVRLHCGTAAVIGRVRLLGLEALAPGERAVAHLKTQEPLVMAAGDRFVVRALSPAMTLGGGTVLAVKESVTSRLRPVRVDARFEIARQAAELGDHLMSQWAAGPSAIENESDLVRWSRLAPTEARNALEANRQIGRIVDLGAGAWLLKIRSDEVVARLRSLLQKYHAKNPQLEGMERALACQLFGLPPESFDGLASVARQDPEIVEFDGRLRLASFSPRLSSRRARMLQKIMERVRASGIRAPARGDLTAALGIPKSDMEFLISALVRTGIIKLLANNLVLTSTVEAARRQLLDLFKSTAVVELGTFKRATGLSRKLAQALLESFDAEGLTRRVGPGRVLVFDAEKTRAP